MSNIQRTERAAPLTYTAAAGVWTTTHGKAEVTKATEATLGTNARGAIAPAAAPAATGAHFHLVTFGATRRPPRYLDVLAKATGSAAADLDTPIIVELYDANAAVWYRAERCPAQGATVAAADTDGAWSKGERWTVKVGRADIAGRFYIPSLATNQGLDIVVNADNDD